MKKTAPLKIGAIGCGGLAAGVHFPGIKRIPELELVALCDIDKDRLALIAGQFGVNQTFADFNEMLDECELDGVSIIGPPSMHVMCAKVCLERQIPFLVEKPVATTVEDARELMRLSEKYGDCGQVGFTSRFSPAQRLARRISLLPEFGPISDITTMHRTHCTMEPYWDITDPKEAFINLHGVHGIDLWRFFGGDPVEVTTTASAYREVEGGYGARGSILVYVRTEDGPHGTIQMMAGAAHSGEITSDIGGELTRVRVENDQHLKYESGIGWIKQVMDDDVLADQFLAEQPSGRYLETGLMAHSYFDFFRFEWIAFTRSLLSGKPLSPSVVDGCKSIILTEAICQSLREDGKPVKVEY